MSHVVIAQFYKTEEDAGKRAAELMELDNGRRQWYVVTANNGSLVMSELQVMKCYPDLFPKQPTYRKSAYIRPKLNGMTGKKKVPSLGGAGGYCYK